MSRKINYEQSMGEIGNGFLIGICGFIYDMEEQNKLKIQRFLLVMFGLLFQSGIQSRYSGKVGKKRPRHLSSVPFHRTFFTPKSL